MEQNIVEFSGCKRNTELTNCSDIMCLLRTFSSISVLLLVFMGKGSWCWTIFERRLKNDTIFDVIQCVLECFYRTNNTDQWPFPAPFAMFFVIHVSDGHSSPKSTVCTIHKRGNIFP